MSKEEFLKYMENWYDGMKNEFSNENIKKVIKNNFKCIELEKYKRHCDSAYSIVVVLDFYQTKNFFEWLEIDFEEWLKNKEKL